MKTMKTILLVLASVSLALAGAAASAQVASQKEVKLSIERQTLRDALNEWAQQTGYQLVSEVSGTYFAPSVTGTLTPRAALERLLAGSSFTYEWLSDRVVVIRKDEISAHSSQIVTSQGRQPRLLVAHLQDLSASSETADSKEEERPNEASQPNPRESEVGHQNSGQGRRNARMEEVIVTAQKRTERLQDVPISIAVLSAVDIDQRGLVHAEDYLRGTPGVNQVESVGGAAVVIRGLETTVAYQNFGSGPTAATYFGETPTTYSGGMNASNVDIKLVDIERVEVLRGPQGTAFGSASLGGAVRTIPVAPRLDRFEGKVAAAYSVTADTGGDNYSAQAVGNLPLIMDKLAIRAVAYQYQDSGFYRNRAGSDAAFQTAFVAPFGLSAFTSDEDEVGAYHSIGGRIAALFQANDNLRFTLNYLKQENETDGWPISTSGTFEQTLIGVAPEHIHRGQESGNSDDHIDIASAVMEYDFGWADLLATYSHLESGEEKSVAYGPSGIFLNLRWAASDVRDLVHRENVGEIRLVTKFDGPWNFLGGLYGEKQYDRYSNVVIWHGNPATNIFGSGTAVYDQLFRRDVKQNAAFGEVSWEFLSGLTLTGGVRAYDYERTQQQDRGGPLFRGVSTSTRVDADESGAIYRANLSYKPDKNTHIYTGWSQGFRLGRPQASVPAALCDADANGIVDGTNVPVTSTGQISSDSVDNYELGGKFAARAGRVTIDAAVYRMDWVGIPVLVRPPCLISYLTNAGSARSEGIEMQASFLATDSLRFDVGGSYADARLTDDVPVQGYKAGDRLPGAPRFNANLGVQQDFDIGGLAAYLRADAIYIGTFHTVIRQSPSLTSGDYVKLDASMRISLDNLNIDLFVRNLTNEDAFTSRGHYAVSPTGEYYGYRLRPRTIGLQLGYNF